MMLTVFSAFCFGQIDKQWTTNVNGSINWQQVTPTGHFITGTSAALVGISPETGQVQWSLDRFAGLPQEAVQQVGSSPLISVNQNNNVYMIDPFSGEVKFDAQKAGVSTIIDKFILYKSNGILVAGKDASNKPVMVFANMEDGQIGWKINDDYGRVITVNELNKEEMLIVTIFNNYKLKSKSGDIVWKNDTSDANKQLDKLGAFGGMMKQVAANQAEKMDFNVQFYKHPSKDVFYIASEQTKESSFSSSSSTSPPPVTYFAEYHAYDMNNGNRLWAKPLSVEGKISQIFFHDQGLVILPDNDQNTKINMYDYTTQEGKWGKKGNGIRVKGGIYDYVPVTNGLLLVSNKNGKNYLSYVDTNLGLLTFDKPVKVDGEVMRSEKIDKGVLFITSETLNILNTSTGELFFEKGIYTSPAMVKDAEGKSYIFDYNTSTIKVLDKSTAAVKELSSESLTFDGKEGPHSMELRSDGIFINSDQNVALFDMNGKLVYNSYFEAPRETGLKRALLYAQAVRAAYIGAASYAVSGAYQAAAADVKKEDAATGAVVEVVGQAYGELGDAATDFAKKSFQQANARFKASTQARDYMIILTRMEGTKTNALVKVDKNTGKADNHIDLGKEMKPNYAVDDVTGKVFYQTGPSTITAYFID